MRSGWYYICVYLLLLTPCVAGAQFDLPGSSASLTVQPRVPAPGDTFSVSLNDFSSDGGGGRIDWFIDDTSVPNSQNARSLTAIAGELGVTQTITARITTGSGAVSAVSTTITPARLAIIVEGDTTVPSWYQGRPMPSIGAPMVITAVPNNGSGADPDTYTYTWRFNNDVVNAGATLGQTQNRFIMPAGRYATVRVTVNDSTGKLIAERSIGIPPQEPEVHFYERNALRGIVPVAISNPLQLIGSEINIKAEPYFMTTTSGANFLEEWSINGRVIENPNSDNSVLTLQNGGGRGSFTVRYHTRNLQELLQGVEAGFNVQF